VWKACPTTVRDPPQPKGNKAQTVPKTECLTLRQTLEANLLLLGTYNSSAPSKSQVSYNILLWYNLGAEEAF
jgi:hypothetical protein